MNGHASRITCFLLVSCGLLLNCSESKAPDNQSPAPAPQQADTAALTRVTTDTKNLLFRYSTDAGFATATAINEIPKPARKQVHVIDLSRSPKARRSTSVVQVFDLSSPQSNGTYTGRLVPRRDIERVLARVNQKATQKAVTMYSASWCGVCTKARSFLTAQGIPFVEKDIDKDKRAKRELTDKARKAGVQASGVPVFDINGKILPGFDANRILSLVKGG